MWKRGEIGGAGEFRRGEAESQSRGASAVAMHWFIDGEIGSTPDSLEDCVGEENSVRMIDAFIEELELAALGVSAAAAGRLAHHPSTPLKIYLYGYLDRWQSIRRLEREADDRNKNLIAAVIKPHPPNWLPSPRPSRRRNKPRRPPPLALSHSLGHKGPFPRCTEWPH